MGNPPSPKQTPAGGVGGNQRGAYSGWKANGVYTGWVREVYEGRGGCGGYLTSNIQIIRRITERHPRFHPRNNPRDMGTGHTCSSHDCGGGIWSEGVG